MYEYETRTFPVSKDQTIRDTLTSMGDDGWYVTTSYTWNRRRGEHYDESVVTFVLVRKAVDNG